MQDAHPVRVLRKALEMTQVGFAESIGISGQYQWQVESGREVYGRETALAIADLYRDRMEALSITVEDLLRGSRSAA